MNGVRKVMYNGAYKPHLAMEEGWEVACVYDVNDLVGEGIIIPFLGGAEHDHIKNVYKNDHMTFRLNKAVLGLKQIWFSKLEAFEEGSDAFDAGIAHIEKGKGGAVRSLLFLVVRMDRDKQEDVQFAEMLEQAMLEQIKDQIQYVRDKRSRKAEPRDAPQVPRGGEPRREPPRPREPRDAPPVPRVPPGGPRANAAAAAEKRAAAAAAAAKAAEPAAPADKPRGMRATVVSLGLRLGRNGWVVDR